MPNVNIVTNPRDGSQKSCANGTVPIAHSSVGVQKKYGLPRIVPSAMSSPCLSTVEDVIAGSEVRPLAGKWQGCYIYVYVYILYTQKIFYSFALVASRNATSHRCGNTAKY